MAYDLSQRAPGLVLCMAGRNAKPYLADAFRAISRQTLTPKAIIVLDDASDDDTAQEATRLVMQYDLQAKTLVRRNPKNLGKVRSVYTALKSIRFHSDDVVVMHDLDDYLAGPTALQRLWSAYAEGWDVVYSNHRRTSKAGGKSFCAQVDPFLALRHQDWLTSHLFSFRAHLMGAVEEPHVKSKDGSWFASAGDMVFAFLVTDQTPYILYLDEILMVYRDDLVSNDGHSGAGRQLQRRVERELRARDTGFSKRYDKKTISLGQLIGLKAAADAHRMSRVPARVARKMREMRHA